MQTELCVSRPSVTTTKLPQIKIYESTSKNHEKHFLTYKDKSYAPNKTIFLLTATLFPDKFAEN